MILSYFQAEQALAAFKKHLTVIDVSLDLNLLAFSLLVGDPDSEYESVGTKPGFWPDCPDGLGQLPDPF